MYDPYRTFRERQTIRHRVHIPIASRTQPTVPSPPQQITLKLGTSLNIVRPVKESARECVVYVRDWQFIYAITQYIQLTTTYTCSRCFKLIVLLHTLLVPTSSSSSSACEKLTRSTTTCTMRANAKNYKIITTHPPADHLWTDRTPGAGSACTGICAVFGRPDGRRFSD